MVQLQEPAVEGDEEESQLQDTIEIDKSTGTQSPHSVSRKARPRQPHVCSECGARFSRLEHLARHALGHSDLRTHTCQGCQRRYSRRDVLHRHHKSCPANKDGSFDAARLQQRNHACRLCNETKVKCSGGERCQRCTNLDRTCFYPSRRQKRKNAAPPLPSPSLSTPRRTDSSPSRSLEETDSSEAPAQSQIADEALLFTTNEQSFHASQLQADFDCTPENYISQSQVNELTFANHGVNNLPFSYGESSIPQTFFDDADTFFNFDPLDWAMINTMFADPPSVGAMPTGYEQSAYDLLTSTSNVPVAPLPSADLVLNSAIVQEDSLIPDGLSWDQFDPLEGHRKKIIRYLKDRGCCEQQDIDLLSRKTISLFLYSYFDCFHCHAPMLHVPRWSIATTTTPLFFAMILVGAMYAGDLKKYGRLARSLYGEAEAFAWEASSQSTGKSKIALETLQALYLLSLLDAFYFAQPGRPAKTDFKRLVDAAREGNYFEESTQCSLDNAMGWEQWAERESRKRTAFILYLFDTVRAIFFGEPPLIRAYELRLSLPSHERTFAAKTPAEWWTAWNESRQLTTYQYPIIYLTFGKRDPIEGTMEFSIMGTFIILHGILMYLWESQKFEYRPWSSLQEGEADVLDQLTQERNAIIDQALHKWRGHWNDTVASPMSSGTSGLYRDRAIAYWFLGRLMNGHDRTKFRIATEDATTTTTGTPSWSMRIPRLMKHLIMKLDRGQLNPSDDLDNLETECRDGERACERSDENSETMDALNVNFIMYRRKQDARVAARRGV